MKLPYVISDKKLVNNVVAIGDIQILHVLSSLPLDFVIMLHMSDCCALIFFIVVTRSIFFKSTDMTRFNFITKLNYLNYT